MLSPLSAIVDNTKLEPMKPAPPVTSSMGRLSHPVFRHPAAQFLAHRARARIAGSRQPREHFVQKLAVVGHTSLGDPELGVRCRKGLFCIGQWLLVELFPWAEPRVPDLDVAFRKTGQANHLLREIRDSH